MRNLIISKQYHNHPIKFDLTDDNLLINLTEMAKANGKEVYEWVRLDSTKSYLSKLESIDLTNLKPSEFPCLKNLKAKSGNNGGTWGSRRVAIRLAQWLSDEFAIWVDTQIEELLTHGKVSLPNQPHALIVPANYLEALQQLTIVESERQRLQAVNDALMHTMKTYTTSEIGKSLGMSANELNKILHQKGIQYKQNGTWLLYAKYQNYGLTEIRQGIDKNNGYAYYNTHWTQKGRLFILSLLNREVA